MLSHVRVNKKEYKTCIQELGNEYTIGNLRKHFRLCVISNRRNQLYDNGLQDKIESNDNECNHLTKDFRSNFVWEINLAECFLLTIQYIYFVLLFFCLMSAETLHDFGVHRLSVVFLELLVIYVFFERLLFPIFHIKSFRIYKFFSNLFAVCDRIPELEANWSIGANINNSGWNSYHNDN